MPSVFARPDLHNRLCLARYGALVLLVLLAPTAVLAEPPETYNLRPDWTPGQTARYEVWSSRTQQATVTVAGESRATQFTLTSEGEMTWAVQKVKPDGSSVCTMTFDWIKVVFVGDDGKKLVSDSRKGSGDIESFHGLIKAMAGTAIKVTVATDGTVTAVDGVGAIRNKIKSDLKEMVPEDLDFIEAASDLATLVAAPQDIAVGKKWDADAKWTWSDPPFEGHMHHDMSFTFAGVEELAGLPVAMVEGRSKLKLELDRSSIPEEMPPYDVKLAKGELQTQVMFDLTRGEAVGRNSVQTTTIDVTIRMPSVTITRRIDQTLQGQVLRIQEQ